MNLKIGICDDNKIFLSYLFKTIQELYIDSENITIESVTPYELSRHIQNKTCPYHIIITDIDMGNFNGIEFTSRINTIDSSCMIIFISNYLNYATEVYDVDHIYFVLKSEVESRLPKALEKALLVYYEKMNQYLTIRYQNVDYQISIMDILYIEAMGRYLYIHIKEKSDSYKCINSLKIIANDLPDSFVRCHNSYIVNMRCIRSISRTNCILSDGSELSISQTYYKKFQSSYLNFVSRKLL